MKVTMILLARAATDVPFSEMTRNTLEVNSAPVAFTPTIPAEVAGQEFILQVQPTDDVRIAVGQRLNRENLPSDAPEAWVRAHFIAWGNAAREISIRSGVDLVLTRPGATAA